MSCVRRCRTRWLRLRVCACVAGYIPRTREERDEQGITERDVYNAVEYYRTPRAQHKNSPDKLRLSGLLAMMSFDPFHLADQLFTQPLLVRTCCIARLVRHCLAALRGALLYRDP